MHRDGCFTGQDLVSSDALDVIFNVHQSDVHVTDGRDLLVCSRTVSCEITVTLIMFIHSLLRPLLWIANVRCKSLLSAALFIWSYRFEPVLSLDRRPMFFLVFLFLVCIAVFLLLLSAEYHNVLM